MRLRLIGAALGVGLISASANAGQFDGKWQANAWEVGIHCGQMRVTLTVSGRDITGEAQSYNSSPIIGTVADDGTFKLRKVTGQPIDNFGGKFDGDRISVEWDGVCGHRIASGSRVGS